MLFLFTRIFSGRFCCLLSFSSYCFFNACQVFLILFLYFSVSLEKYSSINFYVTLYSQFIRNDIFDHMLLKSHYVLPLYHLFEVYFFEICPLIQLILQILCLACLIFYGVELCFQIFFFVSCLD